MVFLALSILAKPASSPQSRYSLDSPPEGTRRLCSSVFSAFCLGDMDNDSDLVVLFDRNDLASEASS